MKRLQLGHMVRSLLYPGLDLHTRNRASLCQFWLHGPRDVLDAGSGNGYFSWLAYKHGGRVVAMNINPSQVMKAEEFLIGYRQADPAHLKFERVSLYDLTRETRVFDEIICYETLEHIRRDDLIVNEFFRVLRPGGVLHLCCPNRSHPRNQKEVLDVYEEGGHVRAGYSVEDYRHLLEPVGFTVDSIVGIGSRALFYMDEILRWVRNHLGDVMALPLLPIALPFVYWSKLNPSEPFSLYVRAVKKGTLGRGM